MPPWRRVLPRSPQSPSRSGRLNSRRGTCMRDASWLNPELARLVDEVGEVARLLWERGRAERDRCCATMDVPAGLEWMQEVTDCEAKVTSRREEGRG